jgi:hypothetical protein
MCSTGWNEYCYTSKVQLSEPRIQMETSPRIFSTTSMR